MALESVAQIEVRAAREECACGGQLRVREQRAATIDAHPIRIVITECRSCGETPVRYYEVHNEPATADTPEPQTH